jgi:hypothetical protein
VTKLERLVPAVLLAAILFSAGGYLGPLRSTLGTPIVRLT